MILLMFTANVLAAYSERVTLSQSVDGRLSAHFRFDYSVDRTTSKNALADAVAVFGASHVSLAFTQGTRCLSDSDIECTSPGLVLWAYLERTLPDPDTAWTGLVNALGGIFCASLNQISTVNSGEPSLGFDVPGIDKNSHWLKFAALPRENTCTENLTPWTKLLPCSTKAGISTLFNAYSIYDADYHSMRVSIHRTCNNSSSAAGKYSSNESNCDVDITQELVLVLDPVRRGAARTIDWTLPLLFGTTLKSACPLDKDGTSVLLRLPKREGFRFKGKNGNEFVKTSASIDGKSSSSSSGSEWYIPLAIGKELDFGVEYDDSTPNRDLNPMFYSPIQVHRHLTGYGRARGGLSIQIRNVSPHEQDTTLLQLTPWFMKLLLHTLVITPTPSVNHTVLKYVPAIPRTRPSLVELSIRIPANSSVSISVEFKRAFIKYTEHPADANRGFDIPPAVVSYAGGLRRVWSGISLLALPTPDFSMPFNVITMTCTGIALYFGGVFGVLTKEVVGVRDEGAGFLGRIMGLARRLLRGGKSKVE